MTRTTMSSDSHFTVPPNGTAHPSAVEERPASRPAGSETLLLVEDDDRVLALACRGLREHGYSVLEASRGEEALALVRGNPGRIDLVVSDVVMPDLGGRELAARLALLEPSLPVLFMSGYTGDDAVQRGLLEPGVPFQEKPFSPEGLARMVRDLLDGRRTAPAG